MYGLAMCLLLVSSPVFSASMGSWKVHQATESWILGQDVYIADIRPSSAGLRVTFGQISTGQTTAMDGIRRIEAVRAFIPDNKPTHTRIFTPKSTPIYIPLARKPTTSMPSLSTLRRYLTDPKSLNPSIDEGMAEAIKVTAWKTRKLSDGKTAWNGNWDNSGMDPRYEIVSLEDEVQSMTLSYVGSQNLPEKVLNGLSAMSHLLLSVGFDKSVVMKTSSECIQDANLQPTGTSSRIERGYKLETIFIEKSGVIFTISRAE